MQQLRIRFFERIYRLVRYRAWWILFLSLFLSTLALYFIRELPIKDSFLDLLPSNDPLLEQFKLREPLLQQSDSLNILLRFREGAAPRDVELRGNQLRALADQIIERLLLHSEFLSADYLLDPRAVTLQQLASDETRLAEFKDAIAAMRQSGLDTLFPQLGGQSDLTDLFPELNERATLADIYAVFNDRFQNLSSGQDNLEFGEVVSALDELKTFNAQVASIFTQIPGQLKQATAQVTQLSGLLDGIVDQLAGPIYDESADKGALRILVKPSKTSLVNVNFNRAVLRIVKQAVDEVVPPSGPVQIYVAGSYAFSAESNQALRSDMLQTTLISIVGILIIFVLTFRGRSLIYPFLIIIPLSMGAVWMTAWAKYVLGGFNLVTSLLPALILGLGINYGIHFVGRFLEERQRGLSLSTALHHAILNKGDAVLSGAITTGLVFFVMTLSKSRGLYEMGLVAGFGVLVSALLTLFVLPSLIVISHLVLRRFLWQPKGYRWGLGWGIKQLLRARIVVISVILLVTVGVMGPASGVRIQFVSEELITTGLPSQKALDALNEAGFSELGGEGNFFLFFVPTEEKVNQLDQQLNEMDLVLQVRSIKYFQDQTLFLQDLDLDLLFSGVNDVIKSLNENLENKPELSIQLANMQNTLSFWKDLAVLYGQRTFTEESNLLIGQVVDIQNNLNQLNVEDLGRNLRNLQTGLEQIRNMANTLVLPKNIGDFLDALPEESRKRLITPENEYIVYVQVDKTIYLARNYERFKARVESITTDFVGFPLLQNHLEQLMKQDFWLSTLGALGLIILSLFVDFSAYRMLSAPFLVLLPLVLGYIWMLGGMGLLGISFNLTNMVISPLLIGIGVDNGIHLLHRYMELPNDTNRVQTAAESVAVPTLVANLTTMVAFGSLIFASTPGLQVLGKSALLGVGAVAFCSLTLLPAVLARRR